MSMIETRKCKGKCGLKKPLSEFYSRIDKRGKTHKVKYESKCKTCISEEGKKKRSSKPPKIKAVGNAKYCTWCDELKEINETNFPVFYTRSGEKRLQHRCKDCQSNGNKQWRTKNKARKAINDKAYHQVYFSVQTNIDRKLEWQKGYRKRADVRKRENDKLNNDPFKKFRARISTRIYQELKANGSSKNGESMTEHLDINEMWYSIDAQFKLPGNEWMSWEKWKPYDPETWDDNDQSTWTLHIDHYPIPQCDLPYDSYDHPNFKKCWAPENLRPYPAKWNIIEGNRKGNRKKRTITQ
jgi:hypothetical protein